MEAAILKITLKFKTIKVNLLIKSRHTHTLLTNVIFVYYANTHFMGFFHKNCVLEGFVGKKKQKKTKNKKKKKTSTLS